MGCGPSNSNKVLGENGGASEINAESMAARIGYRKSFLLFSRNLDIHGSSFTF